ncbi:MAG: Sporulation kinase A [Syntrophorhabdus sp. PtaU1.Bin153]|nr:MAG: Sporulation kinase A [Syntrophorhabdus sp. PtaU1.Bin153]
MELNLAFAEILETHRDKIVREWAHRLHSEVGGYYLTQSVQDLSARTSEATDANFAILVDNDFTKVDAFLGKVGKSYTESALPLSDLLKAFELYRSIVMPYLIQELQPGLAVDGLQRLNECLSYTTRKSSDYFQGLRDDGDYTEKIQAELAKRRQELEESEGKFRDLAEKATVGIYVAQDGLFKYVNAVAAKILGYTVEEMTCGMGPKDIVFHEDWPIVEENIRRRMTGEIESSYSEFRMVTKDAEMRNVEVYTSQTTYRGRTAIIGTLIDVTERKQAQEALEKSERRYRGLFESLRDGFMSVSMDGRYVETNSAFQSMVGYGREELLNLPHTKITPSKWHAFEDRIIKHQVLKRGYSDIFGKEYIRKDGTVFPAEVRAYLERDKDGIPVKMWALARDISERKKAEKALKEGELKYRTLFESANDAIFLMKDNVCVDCNAKALTLFGCTKRQMVGQKPFAFSPETQPDGSESSSKSAEKIKAVMSGTFQFFEWRHCRLDGTPFDVEVSLNRIELEGELLLQGIIRDITARKQYEEELRSKSLALEEVNAALKVLLQQREKDKDELEEKILHNVRQLIFPYLDKLKRYKLNAEQKSCVSVLEANLRNIVSPFIRKMTSINLSFTPTEIRVAHLIREGKTVKEIASLLGVSESAINLHRQNLRDKLGLKKVKVNLATYLMSSFE